MSWGGCSKIDRADSGRWGGPFAEAEDQRMSCFIRRSFKRTQDMSDFGFWGLLSHPPPPPRRNVTSHSDVTLLPSLSSSFPVGCIFFLSSKLLKCCYFSSFSLPMGHAVAFALFLSWLCPHLVHPSSKPGCCLRSKPDLRHPHGPLVMWPDAVHIH